MQNIIFQDNLVYLTAAADIYINIEYSQHKMHHDLMTKACCENELLAVLLFTKSKETLPPNMYIARKMYSNLLNFNSQYDTLNNLTDIVNIIYRHITSLMSIGMVIFLKIG